MNNNKLINQIWNFCRKYDLVMVAKSKTAGPVWNIRGDPRQTFYTDISWDCRHLKTTDPVSWSVYDENYILYRTENSFVLFVLSPISEKGTVWPTY